MKEESSLTVTEESGVSVILFDSPTLLDTHSISLVAKQLYDLVEKNGLKKLALDLSSTKMISSRALGILLNLRQKLDEANGKMVICGVDPKLYRVFKITNLHNLFEFFSDKETAIAEGF